MTSHRIHTHGNSRAHEFHPRSHRRDSAWRAHVEGTRLEPMEKPGFWARLFGRR